MNKTLEYENNNNISNQDKKDNKQNLTTVLDNSNEDNMNTKVQNDLIFNNTDINKGIEQSSLRKNNSFNMNERKIISIIESNKIPKQKKIKFNDLPIINSEKKENKDKNKKDIDINIEKDIQELESENMENKEENDFNKIEEYNKLEINYKQMYKELEELKNENSYIKNKLEEISKSQKNKKGIINIHTSKPKKNINMTNKNISKNEFSTYNKYKKNLNIKKVTPGWNSKIPLLTSCTENSNNKNARTKRLYGINSFKNIARTNNNISTYKKRDKSEFEKFNDIKNKFLLKNNKILTKSESYNNFNKSLSNELKEKNKIIKKLNNNLAEQNKITENRISLLIKDKNVINERLYLLKKEKEEYKIKKESEIKNYINDLNNNQKIINELNTEKERLIKSKNEIELLNHKLKNIILEEKSKRKEYEHMYKIHNLEIKEKENNEYGYKNKESIMKLKYDIMLKENKEMKQELNLLKEKLAKTQIKGRQN